MKCPIRFGKLNKWHFCLLATVGLKFFDSLISGIPPAIKTSKQEIFLYKQPPIFIKHPFIKALYSFLGIFIIGLIIYIMKKIEEKKILKEEGLSETKKEINDFGPDKKEYNHESFKENFLVIIIFVFAILISAICDSLEFNDVKLWPIGYLCMYFFSKKILNKILYKHQKLAIILILIICIAGCLISSFISEDDSGCGKYEENSDDYENCLLNNENSYGKIIHKLGWVFIPIIMTLYLISMTANSYGLVKIKYLTDFKFIEIYKILMMLGISGFFISMISVVVFNYISCGQGDDKSNKIINIQDICKINDNEKKLYFDSFFIYFGSLNKDNIFLEITIALIFQVVNSLQPLSNLLIIKKLDPFYLILIKFLLSINDSTKLVIIKYVILFLSNLFAIICSLIYIEIIILNFNDYEKDTRENIIDRERIDSGTSNEEEDSKEIEIEIADNYVVVVG